VYKNVKRTAKIMKMIVRFGVDMAVSIKIMVSWVVTPCNLLDKCIQPVSST
jgi:hypothetical protein